MITLKQVGRAAVLSLLSSLGAAVVAQAPDLSANLVSGPSSAQAGTAIAVTRNITNIGGTTGWNGSFTYDVRLSTNTTISATDPLVTTVSSLATGTQTISVTIPSSIAVGTYFLGIIVNPVSGEGNTSNNSIASTGTIQISAAAPDLNAVSISGPAIIVPGQQLAVTRNITNVGGPITAAAMVYEIRLSTDTTLTTADPLIATFNSSTLGVLTTPNFTLPAGTALGTYYYGLVVGTTTGETNAANNLVVSTATVLVTNGLPTLTQILPNTGPTAGGTTVTLTGTNFLGTPAVTFNGVAATAIVVNSPTQIVCVTPANPAGQPLAAAVQVTNANGSASSSALFIYGQPYPGTNEDFTLLTAINGTPNSTPQKQATAGNILSILLISSGGAFNGSAPILVAQGYLNGFPPFGIAGFPYIHVDPVGALVVFNGAQLPGGYVLPLPAGGLPFQYSVPVGLVGYTLRLQGLALSAAAGNGAFAASHAHDIVFF